MDTGASLTLLDSDVAEEIDVRYIGRKARVIIADGHEVEAELAIVNKLVIESEELPYAYVAVMSFST